MKTINNPNTVNSFCIRWYNIAVTVVTVLLNLYQSEAAVSAGPNHLVAIRTNGSLWGLGQWSSGELSGMEAKVRGVPIEISSQNWSSAAAGLNFTVAVKSDGTLWSWGRNYLGQLGPMDKEENPSQVLRDHKLPGSAWQRVECGNAFVVAQKDDGTLWAWGSNRRGQLGIGKSEIAVSDSVNRPQPIRSSDKWIAFSVGSRHCLAIKQDGTLWAWGEGGNGVLGDGSTEPKNAPIQIGIESEWAAVAAGQLHSLAVRKDGTLWAWGANNFGQLGDGGYNSSSRPKQIGDETNWLKVAAGDAHTLAIKRDGSLWSWGANSHGELGLGDFDRRAVPTLVSKQSDWSEIEAGSGTSLAVTLDGELWFCGWSRYTHFDKAMIPNQPCLTFLFSLKD